MSSKTNKKNALSVLSVGTALALSTMANANSNLQLDSNAGLQVKSFGKPNYTIIEKKPENSINTNPIAIQTQSQNQTQLQVNQQAPVIQSTQIIKSVGNVNTNATVNNVNSPIVKVVSNVNYVKLTQNRINAQNANNLQNLSNNQINNGGVQYIKTNGMIIKRVPIKRVSTQSNENMGNQKIIRVKRVKVNIPPHDSAPTMQAGTEQYYYNIENIVQNNVLSNNYQSTGGFYLHKQSGFIRPVNYRINSPYGMRFHPVDHKMKMHTGVDFAAPMGTPIRAVADGVVSMSQWHGGYGKMVLLDHTRQANGSDFSTLYGHASKLIVKVGQQVRQGDIIAYVGSTGKSTGPHLHFEIFKDGKRINPATLIPDKQTI